MMKYSGLPTLAELCLIALFTGMLVSAPIRAGECDPEPENVINAHVIKPKVIVKNIDSLEAPYIDDLNEDISDFIQDFYPQLRQQLSLPTPHPLPSDSVICVFLHHLPMGDTGNGSDNKQAANARVKAHGDKNIIRIYDSFLRLRRYRSDIFHWGLLTHEMTHLLQNPYTVQMSRWIQEGMADYVMHNTFLSQTLKWFLDRTAKTLKKMDSESEPFAENSFTTSYRRTICPYNLQGCRGFRQDGYRMHSEPVHTAGLMVMIDKLYAPGFLPMLHSRLYKARVENSSFSDEDVSNYLYHLTDKTLDDLWCEYIVRTEGVDDSDELAARCPANYWRNPARQSMFYKGLPYF